MRTRLATLAALALGACGPAPVPPASGPAGPPRAPRTPSVCAIDLSDWSFSGSRSGFVPDAVVTRAARPAVLAVRYQVCACARHAGRWPTRVKLRITGYPNEGRAEAVLVEGDGGLAECVGTVRAHFPPFDFRGDVVECPPGAQTGCSTKPASFAVPLVLPLD
jgi:hypothetical protein